jgi:putative ABC transport system permease protein
MAVADSAVTGETERGLTQVRAVDGFYPLVGEAVLDPVMPLAEAFEARDGRYGVVMERLLAERLGIAIGDPVRLGSSTFELRAVIERVPDAAASGFALGPRTLVLIEGLEGSGLLQPGSLYETEVRITLPEDANLPALEAELARDFPDAGIRWRDRTRAAPGVERFVERIGSFLVLVGLAALAVGGVGVSAAVRSLSGGEDRDHRHPQDLGASGDEIFAIYLIQIGALALLGVGIGLALGGGGPALLGPVFADALPVPALFDVYARPMAEAAIYGLLTALLFALWPLARAREVRAAGCSATSSRRTRNGRRAGSSGSSAGWPSLWPARRCSSRARRCSRRGSSPG